MGYNTGILLLNDALPAAEYDKEDFAANLLAAIRVHTNGKANESVDFAIGNNVNGGTVFWQSHADETGVFALGGNYATHLLTRYNYEHHTKEAKMWIAQQLAMDLGYRLTPRMK